jgi:methyl-accepting chemotaxis protein
MNNNQPKRRHIFIKKSFQGRFILGVFAIILLSGLCSALLIYWITGNELLAQSQSAHTNIVNAGERLGLSIMIGNVISILVAGAVAVVSVLYASHKIAGPLYRFETVCEQVGNGKLDGITSLREHDQLQELGQAFVGMVTKLRSRRDRQAGLLLGINSMISDLNRDTNLTTEQHNILSSLLEAVAQLNKPDD